MRKFFIITAACGLMACEGNTDMVFEVANNSSDTLEVSHRSQFDPRPTIQVLPDEVAEIAVHSMLGGQPEAMDMNITLTSSFQDTLVIRTVTGDTCTKDWRGLYNWESEVEELKKVPANWEHRYRFSVADADF
jgi:hypothetical protein